MLNRSKLNSYLFSEQSPLPLGVFRVLIGIVLFFQTLSWINSDFINLNIVNPPIEFKYFYFNFINPLSSSLLHALIALMLICSVFIIIGKFFRLACLGFFLIFTYFWLIDKGYFNNHYYFISLLTFLLALTDAQKWNIFKLFKDQKDVTVPQWQVFILKFQIFIVFFIAGLNKLNTYWLIDFQPMKHILETKALVSSEFYALPILYILFSYLGLLFDLSIGFLLWFKKSRKIAVIILILFNLTNFLLFREIGEIGWFPLLLVACASIFWDESNLKNLIDKYLVKKEKKSKNKVVQKNEKSSYQSIKITLILGFVLFQFLFPFRHLLIPGHVDYTGQGQRFSWRMKIMYKKQDIQFYFIQEGSSEKVPINVANVLTDKQYTNLIYYPDFIPVVAQHLKSELLKKGALNPKIIADFNIGFMGQEMKPLFDPNLDLTTISYHPHRSNSWIIPLSN